MDSSRLESLSALPYPEQRDLIESVLADEEGVVRLIHRAAPLHDHEPFCFAVRELCRRESLSAEAVSQALHGVFPTLADTAVQRLLRGLGQRSIPRDQLSVLVSCVVRTLDELSIERIAVMCLMLRWLKNADRERYESCCREAIRRAGLAASRSDAEAMSDALLVRLPGDQLSSLAERPAWSERLESFTRGVLEVLERAPKSLSQANAEDLLSRQVYTNPGHFLFELLQNAEDSGASRWRVVIEEKQVSLWHDGMDFDARDVVGILSIGQTTKSKDQIGFFGVGFKSVYEVCERPQVYSGLFRFEIADVSLPRALGRRPGDESEKGTLLVLPLRDRSTRELSPDALFRYTNAIPAETLLTLDNLQGLEMRYGPRFRSVRRRDGVAEARVELVEESGVTTYLVESDRFEFAGSRSSSKAKASPILVALSLDDQGDPEPLKAAHSVFSYLPTGERSGLPFLVHAHFDLTIDRERLDLASDWNRWALACSGELLARAGLRLAEEHRAAPDSTDSLRRLRAFLRVVPHQAELGRKGYAVVVETIQARLASAEVLIDAAGELATPEQSVLCWDEQLTGALAGVSIDARGRRVLGTLAQREATAARTLGAGRFEPPDLVALLVRTFAPQEGRRDTASSTSWVSRALPNVLESLGRTETDVKPLRTLPWLPDQSGRARAPENLARANERLRRIYGDSKPLLSPSLCSGSSPAREGIFDRLGIPVLRAEELIEDLREGVLARALTDPASIARLFAYLDELPAGLTIGLGELDLFPDEKGRLHPLVGLDSATKGLWLAPAGELGTLLRELSHRSLSFVSQETQERFEPLLRRLGARRLDLESLVTAVRAGEIQLDDRVLRGVHQTLERQHAEITPRLGVLISETPLFPDQNGALHPLRGPDRARLASDDEVRALLPNVSWVAQELAGLEYVKGLRIEPLGPAAVVRALLLEEPDDPLIDPFDDGQLRQAYGYLVKVGHLVPTHLSKRLVEAPLWLDEKGRRGTLADSRKEALTPALAAFYDAWGRHPLIQRGPNSSFELARALGVEERVATADHHSLVRDLVAARGRGLSEDLRPSLNRALNEAASILPPAELASLARVPLFLSAEGRVLPLGSWQDAANGQLCYRANPIVREVLAKGSRPLLDRNVERELAPLLEALPIPVAGVEELVSALKSDRTFRRPPVVDEVRRALASLARDAASSFTPPAGSPDHPTLRALPIWPTTEGSFLAAHEVTRRDDLQALLPNQWERVAEVASDFACPILADQAVPEADALRGLVAFRHPMGLLIARLEREMKVGEPLHAQPSFAAGLDRLIAILTVVHDHLESTEAALKLPLVLDREGKIQQGLHHSSTPEELDLFRNLDGLPKLADPRWGARAAEIDPSLAPRLSARSFLDALAKTSRDPTPAADHPCLGSLRQRELLYRWLLERGDEIALDANAKGILGKARIIPNATGKLCAPRDLLLDPSLPDLGLGYGVAEELPEKLVTWLRNLYELDEKWLRQLVEHVLEGHREAAASRNLERSRELLLFLARVLRTQTRDANLAPLASRFKLHRQLKVATDRDEYERPKRLLMPLDERWVLIEAFHPSPPLRVSASYLEPEVRELLLASGARSDLDDEALVELFHRESSLRTGKRARMAFARYVSLRALEVKALRNKLDLDNARWVPNGAGELSAPTALYWPHETVTAILGHRPGLLPDPEIYHTVPERLGTWLPFRQPHEIELSDVAQRLEELDSPPPVSVLDWLEGGLDGKRLKPSALRKSLLNVVFLEDDAGVFRAPREIVPFADVPLFGGRRGSWAGSERFARFASALRMSSAARPKEILEFLAEVEVDLDDEGLLEQEPELLSSLPLCLERLALGPDHSLPRRIPLICIDHDQELSLRLSDMAEVVLDSTSSPKLEGAEGVRPLLPDGARDEALEYLRRLGRKSEKSLGEPPSKQPWKAAAGQKAESRSGGAESVDERATVSGEPSGGFFDRVRRWWKGAEEAESEPTVEENDRRDEQHTAKQRRQRPRGAARPPRPGGGSGGRGTSVQQDDGAMRPDGRTGASRHADWFRPKETVESQLRGARSWLQDRQIAPRYGLSFSPSKLPLPWTYGVQLLSTRFDSRSQSWYPEELDPAWMSPARSGRDVVRMHGRIPAGEVVLPTPLYGRVRDIEAGQSTRLVTTRDGRTLLLTEAATDVRCSVILDRAPDFAAGGARLADGAPESLLRLTAPDDELPDEVHEFLAEFDAHDPSPLEGALEVRRFIRERYRYDPTYLEDDGVARWLRNVSLGRANMHIAALHAGRDDRHLGRGVCFELNVLACELLRRCEIPAAIAVGWTFSDGALAEPDHLWAMALLPTTQGPRWLPIDAATTREGRPLRLPRRPPGPWRVKTPRRGSLPEEPSWDRKQTEGRKKRKILNKVPTAPADAPLRRRGKIKRAPDVPVADLVRVLRHVESSSGRDSSTPRILRRRATDLLRDREELLRLLDGED